MTEVIKLLAVILFIIFLIRRKWKLEYIILLASLLLGLLFELSIGKIILNFMQAISEPVTSKINRDNCSGFFIKQYLKKDRKLKGYS